MNKYLQGFIFVILLFVITVIQGCNKNDANGVAVLDPRDSISGSYFCALHYYYYNSNFNNDTVIGYDTVTVLKASNALNILVNGHVFVPVNPPAINLYDTANGSVINPQIVNFYGLYDSISFLISTDEGTNGGNRYFYQGAKIR